MAKNNRNTNYKQYSNTEKLEYFINKKNYAEMRILELQLKIWEEKLLNNNKYYNKTKKARQGL